MYKNRNTLQEIFETWILRNKTNNFSTPSWPRISLVRSFWLRVEYWLFLRKKGAIWYYWNRHRHYRAGLEDSTKFTAVQSDRTNRFGVLPAEIQMVLAQCTASRKRYWRQTHSDSKWLKFADNKFTQSDFTSFNKRCFFKFALLPFPVIAWATYPNLSNRYSRNYDPSISRIFQVEYLAGFWQLAQLCAVVASLRQRMTVNFMKKSSVAVNFGFR